MKSRFAGSGLIAIAVAVVPTGCGGGTEGTGAVPPTAQAIISTGPMTRGSVVVNGVRFDDSAAVVTDDRGRSAAQLANGMVVKLHGRSDDGATGVADRIDVENEVRGAIEDKSAGAYPPRFVVAGLTVVVDESTVYAGVANFDALAVGMRVEVHGLRDATGLLRATRIEGNAPAPDELRGPVSAIDPVNKTFVIDGNVTVQYAAAAFNPPGAGASALADGAIVEVRGTLAGRVFSATTVDLEALEDATFDGRAGEKLEVEGFVSGFTGTGAAFQVGGRTVRIDSGTRFDGGTAADLANDLRVEVEGAVDAAGVLVASRIEFKRVRVELEGRATAVNAAARTLVVLGQTVRATDLTRIETRGGNGTPGDLANIDPNADCVDVRGFVDANGNLIADEIKEESGCGIDTVQAPVSAKDPARFELTFFGRLVARLDGGAVQFRDAGGNLVSRDAFFAAITAAAPGVPGTLVEVKGFYTDGVLVGAEAEIED